MSDFSKDWDELEKLVREYDSKFGDGKGHEIIGSLMCFYSIEAQIKIFKKAAGREIILESEDGVLDAAKVIYK